MEQRLSAKMFSKTDPVLASHKINNLARQNVEKSGKIAIPDQAESRSVSTLTFCVVGRARHAGHAGVFLDA